MLSFLSWRWRHTHDNRGHQQSTPAPAQVSKSQSPGKNIRKNIIDHSSSSYHIRFEFRVLSMSHSIVWHQAMSTPRLSMHLYLARPATFTDSTLYISMGWCKKDVTPLLTHWSYVILALTHRYSDHLFQGLPRPLVPGIPKFVTEWIQDMACCTCPAIQATAKHCCTILVVDWKSTTEWKTNTFF